MCRTLVISLVSVALSFPLLAHEPEKHEPAYAVTLVLQRSAEAFERGDLRALDSMWANDEATTVFESGHANYGWTDYREHHLKPEIDEMKNVKYGLSEIKPHIAGDTAWATFKYTIEADLKSGHVKSGGLGTAVLEKRGSDWKIVHWHSSAPRRTTAASAAKSPKRERK